MIIKIVIAILLAVFLSVAVLIRDYDYVEIDYTINLNNPNATVLDSGVISITKDIDYTLVGQKQLTATERTLLK